MSECDHTVDDVARVDGTGLVLHDGDIIVWGECECGAPTIVTAAIADVEFDAEGSYQHLRDVAGGADA